MWERQGSLTASRRSQKFLPGKLVDIDLSSESDLPVTGSRDKEKYKYIICYFLKCILHSCFDRKSVTCFLQQWTVVALDLLNYHEGDERENSELLLRMIIHG